MSGNDQQRSSFTYAAAFGWHAGLTHKSHPTVGHVQLISATVHLESGSPEDERLVERVDDVPVFVVADPERRRTRCQNVARDQVVEYRLGDVARR